MATPLELLTPGPGRREPPCPHFGPCGGCRAQHIDDSHYAAWKYGLVTEALIRHGLDPEVTEPLFQVPPGTRRRCTLAARRLSRGVALGFHERGSNRIVDITECHILHPDLHALIGPLRIVLDETLHPSEGVDIALTLLDDGVEVLIEAERNAELADRERLAAFANTRDLARIGWRPGGHKPPEPIALRRDGIVTFANIPVVVPPAPFLQASRQGEAHLIALTREALASHKTGRIADLFSGVGTFTIPLAADGARVDAMDSNALAMEALAGSANAAGLHAHVTAMRRNLYRDPLEAKELNAYSAVVLDPPRAGAREQMARLAQSQVGLVVSISCNPGTFARDAATLAQAGFSLERVVPIDQFVWSTHVEIFAVLRRDG